MSNIKSSPKIGQSSSNCIRNFTVQFRRPYEIGMPPDNYNGEYGFDWVRDEYIYPLLSIGGKKDTVMDLLGAPRLVHAQLYKVFNHNVDTRINIPYRYFPSWLYIFATDCKGVYGSEEINKQGACLDIEIHQEYVEYNDGEDIDEKEALTDNGTVLQFEASNDKIKISTFDNNQNTKIIEEPLSNFINSNRNFMKLGYEYDKFNNAFDRNRYFYKKKNAIKIICSGGMLDKNEHIIVKAIRNGCAPVVVGIIYIAQNKTIHTINIVEIDVKVNGEIIPKSKNHELELRNKFFNQALTVFKVVKKEVFDLDLLSVSDTEVKDFVDKWWNKRLKNDGKEKYLEVVSNKDELLDLSIERKNTVDPTEFANAEFIRELKELYWRKKKVGLTPYSEIERNTYIFFAPVSVRNARKKDTDKWNYILGSASFKAHSNILYSEGKYSSDEEFSNAVVIFKDSVEFGLLETYAHELGHALGLTHTFESGEMFKYQKGFTDNFMDYPQRIDNTDSKFIDRLNIMSKYQIDMIYNWSRVGGILHPWKWTYPELPLSSAEDESEKEEDEKSGIEKIIDKIEKFIFE
ncbi:matrixin family metalloprotease [Acinetobacter guillouiae]|uniref:matrixin family metalloprotease n=1 Tax=Acinetobacter guillouiae TaxID=106649 RepID=UPI001250B0B3|nr:matrixin family metalloprotease [Acinetobacter guillouiae]